MKRNRETSHQRAGKRPTNPATPMNSTPKKAAKPDAEAAKEEASSKAGATWVEAIDNLSTALILKVSKNLLP